MVKNLIFLHGALGCNTHWERFANSFPSAFTIHNLNFPAHGNSTSILNAYTLTSLTDFVKDYISKNAIENFCIIGYSMGGYVGLNLLKQRVQGYQLLVTLATKLNWSNEIAETECAKLTVENLAPIMDKLKHEHGDNWDGLIGITRQILESIGNTPINKSALFANQIPTTMLLGSNDRMIPTEEPMVFIEKLPHFNFELLPDQPHNIEKMDEDIVVQACLKHLA